VVVVAQPTAEPGSGPLYLQIANLQQLGPHGNFPPGWGHGALVAVTGTM